MFALIFKNKVIRVLNKLNMITNDLLELIKEPSWDYLNNAIINGG